jgi:uncharacterized protein (TIGR02284 family)
VSNDNKAAISTLNGLIETCKDGANGFRAAAEAVTHADAKALFISRVPVIERAATELQAEVRRLGGDPETTGSVAATVHRGYIGLKAAITGKDEAAIITECLRGEELAVKNYEDALEQPLPMESREIVVRHHRGTVQNLEKCRALATAYQASEPTVAPNPKTDPR